MQSRFLQTQKNTLPQRLWKNLMKLQNKNTHTVDFIRTYSDVLDHTTCQTIIQVFESSDQKERIENDGRPNFT